jgi:hypothetical protein
MKKLFLTAFALIFFSGFVFSQTDIPLHYAETITAHDLKKHLTIVASAEMEGRMTGSEGQRKAARYIQSQFVQVGLKAPEPLNGYQQYYPLFKDTLIPKTLKIGKKKLQYGIGYVLFSGSSAKEKFKSSKIVFCGYGIDDKNYSDYKGKNVKHKVVLILNGEPMQGGKYLVNGTDKSSFWTYSMTRKAAAAKEKGADAVLFINTGWDSIPSATTKNSQKSMLYFPASGKAAKLTTVLMGVQALKNIFDENEVKNILEKAQAKEPLNNIVLEKKMRTKLSFEKATTQIDASNVIGIVEGSDKKDEYLFLTAHYDHLGKKDDVIYYGADDDGSGTVSVIEMAEAFAKAKEEGHGPRRTVVFMTVSGEEEGLWGSQYYSEHPVFPLEKTTADLNTDMIGRIDGGRYSEKEKNYVYVIGNDKLSRDLDPITQKINDKYTRLELDNRYNLPSDPQRIYYRSDHYNFAKKGVPIIFYFDGIHKDYHKPTDTVDKINFELMEKRVRFIFLTAWEMANRDEMLKRDKPL